MGKSIEIELGKRTIAILYEDRAVLAIDKPAGWMLAPVHWEKTSRNLQRELMLSVQAGDFWAKSRNIKYIRFVHRLDAETSGVLLFAKSPGALSIFSKLFESRRMTKKYLAVVNGIPKSSQWTCQLPLSEELDRSGRIHVNERQGREAITEFRVLEQRKERALVEAIPLTGRTHQIRVHLQAAGLPVVGDKIYGGGQGLLALRSIELAYEDPFQRKPISIRAPKESFLQQFSLNSFRPSNVQ